MSLMIRALYSAALFEIDEASVKEYGIIASSALREEEIGEKKIGKRESTMEGRDVRKDKEERQSGRKR